MPQVVNPDALVDPRCDERAIAGVMPKIVEPISKRLPAIIRA